MKSLMHEFLVTALIVGAVLGAVNTLKILSTTQTQTLNMIGGADGR